MGQAASRAQHDSLLHGRMLAGCHAMLAAGVCEGNKAEAMCLSGLVAWLCLVAGISACPVPYPVSYPVSYLVSYRVSYRVSYPQG